MKIEEKRKEFIPITITIETEKEARIFYHLVNWIPSEREWMEYGDVCSITRDELEEFRHYAWSRFRSLVEDIEK